MQHGEHFELRINNVSFTHIHAQEQTKNQFVYEEQKGGQEAQQQSSSTPSYPFQTKSTGAPSQPTSFDFNNPSGSDSNSRPTNSMQSMSGGAPRVQQTNTVRRTRPKPQHVGAPSGWDSVAAAKNEVFKNDDEDEPVQTYQAKPMATNSAQSNQATSFDFNNYGAAPNQSNQNQQQQPAQHSKYMADRQSYNQHKAGVKFNGFQRSDNAPGMNMKKQAYDSYGDSPQSGNRQQRNPPQNTNANGQPAKNNNTNGGGSSFFEFNVEEKKEVLQANLLDDDTN